jgi:hypothetical protein
MAVVVAAPRRAALPATVVLASTRRRVATRDVATTRVTGVPVPPGSSKASQVRVPKYSSTKRATYRVPSRARLGVRAGMGGVHGDDRLWRIASVRSSACRKARERYFVIDARHSADCAKHLPGFGNALQGVQAEILEFNAGASDQILDRARDEYVCAPEVRDPRCDVHGNASDVVRL